MSKVICCICPGIHNRSLTDRFLDGLYNHGLDQDQSGDLLIFPTPDYPAYSAFDIFNFLCKETQTSESRHFSGRSVSNNCVKFVFMSFSAGVVGAMGAALMWQQFGGEVEALIAIDGWGVPLAGNFPIYRISHDHFTHWSSALLGSGNESFYAAPAVEHLEVWRNPQTTQGWWLHPTTSGTQTASPATAASVLIHWLRRHGVSGDNRCNREKTHLC